MKILNWHWHRWTQWDDVDLTIKSIFLGLSSTTGQTRRCMKCNKLRIREIRIEE